ncbi:serine/threonine protein phosphatase [Prauserella cavernicola]|uniref:Serine/threonine protein phosphatase n=1 Tax=Prauserella cavernicola TaxID=2800127 RepID=A0A934QNX2_9PSEU|nr:serine/threonine protein phosphatase [Prauserella cavernicola]MBK1783437.1 serine/threonine protein phosphatase [Prauserella cavernicola]
MSAARRARHDTVSGALASRDDAALSALVDTASAVGVGVGGGSAMLDVDGAPVFVKRVPLTDRELARPRSTANLFGLPLFCHYGIGSPGFTAWRELAANQVVTDGVLSGETELFPLLHHWRVLPGRPPVAAEHADLDAAVDALDGHPAARARLEELAAASHSLVLFSEYLPHPVGGWLRQDPASKAELVERQLAEIVAFLRERELLHLDGHFGNLRTDGERIYLTDFGLATSARFDLSAAEAGFVARHEEHDADYAAMRVVNWLVTDVCGVPMPAGGGPVARNEYVLRCAAGDIPADVPPVVAAILARHAPAAARMNGFYWRLFGGDVHAEYQRARSSDTPWRASTDSRRP